MTDSHGQTDIRRFGIKGWRPPGRTVECPGAAKGPSPQTQARQRMTDSPDITDGSGLWTLSAGVMRDMAPVHCPFVLTLSGGF